MAQREADATRSPMRGSHEHGFFTRGVSLARRVITAADEDDVDIVAAGLAFYGLLGVFPALLAVVSTYGLVANPSDVESVLQSFSRTLPAQARDVIFAGLTAFVQRPHGSLSVGLVFGSLAVLWSASSATSAVVRAVNVAYGLPRHENFFQRRGVALLFTLGGVVGMAVLVPVITALPKLLGLFALGEFASLMRWPILFLLSFLTLCVLYRYAPRKRIGSWRAVVPGALLFTALWLLVCGVYSFYVGRFADYASTYGALQGVIALELWLYISALIMLYGAELNAELEPKAAQEAASRPRPDPT
ncbi:MAG TPA: YihY/virulence factor BrkB family protein [Polyangiaceae bacterium]|jgi:membrane protein